jgi:ubiquinone/menaquinone biosynthesis C-methylase UbiE
MDPLTKRQLQELEYHQEHARYLANDLEPLSYDVVTSSKRRWWNAYWDIWTFLIGLPLRGKRVLVVGCGAGQDALFFAKLGAVVSAFDLSPDMLALAAARAKADGLSVAFAQMPSEKQDYPDDTFDLVFARDILHHVEIPTTMMEICRVSKPNAVFVADEIYSHSITDWIRRSWLVERLLYPAMQRFIYKGEKPYITKDERKMTQKDIAHVKSCLINVRHQKYFNFIVTRLIPDRYDIFAKVDRMILILLGWFGYVVAGRIVFVGTIRK